MKKLLKGLGLSLCAVLLLAGCSCNKDEDNSVKANISNGENKIVSGLKNDAKDYDLQDVYDALKATNANQTTANKLIEILGDLEIMSNPTWKTRYNAKLTEKLKELVENETYFEDGEFSENLLKTVLRSKLYDVTCVAGEDKEPLTDELTCDYSDYITKEINVELITELLKEKYVYDEVLKNKQDLLTSKKIRVVEYISLSSSHEDVVTFINDEVNKLGTEVEQNKKYGLADIAAAWEAKLLAEVVTDSEKIGTDEDSSFTQLKDFTGGYYYDVSEGLKIKEKAIKDKDYYNRVVITSDSNSILNSTLIERILSSDIVSENTDKTYNVEGVNYVVNPLADSKIDRNDIIIKDTSNGLYYVVSVKVIDAATNDGSEQGNELVYDAVKVLATNTSLVSNNLNYYLEKNKTNISVHDEEIYEYLKTLYPTIFVD